MVEVVGALLFDPAGIEGIPGGEGVCPSIADILSWYAAERKFINSDRSVPKSVRQSRLSAAKRRYRLELAARKEYRKSRRLRPMKIVKPKNPESDFR
jgi:hypothetical protein